MQGARELAWSLIGPSFERAMRFEESPRISAEAARIASLTSLVAARTGMASSEIIRAQHPIFSRLSWAAEEEGVEQSRVMSLAASCLDTSSDDAHRISALVSQGGMSELLTLVHSIGCHELPVIGQNLSLRKPLGVFYTPGELSDFIVERTLGPTLDAAAGRVTRDGIEALAPLLSLSVLDPACGPGTFLVSAIEALRRREQNVVEAAAMCGVSNQEIRQYWRSTVLESFGKNLYGVDLDAASLEIADVSISLALHPAELPMTGVRLGITLKQGNSLISLKGINGNNDFSRFFQNPVSKRPFEWANEFPHVLQQQGGFDCVVMNPPYNRLKPNLAEFMREQLGSGSARVDTRGYPEYAARLREEACFYRQSGEYPFSSSHTIDTYRLFVERALSLARRGGSIGFIVPSSILGDVSAESIRRVLLTQHSIMKVFEFPEGAKLFPDVTQSQSIMVLTKGSETHSFDTCFGLRSIQQAHECRPLRMSTHSIRQTMGSTLVIPRVDDNAWTILQQLHLNPRLGTLKWLECRRGELDLTLNRKHITYDVPGARLVRGSHIGRYLLRPPSSEKSESVDIDSFTGELGTSERAKHLDRARIACQQVSNRAQVWRLKFALIPPKTVLANSCNYISVSEDADRRLLLYLLGLLNSYLLNWRFDLSNSNNHVSNRELSMLPIVNPLSAPHDIIQDLIDCVTSTINDGQDLANDLESAVFTLYGVGLDGARSVLCSRRAPKAVKEGILDALSERRPLDKV